MKHPALWLSCTSSRSSFSASRGVPRPMTISMDIHTQLGPNMAHSAQNGLVLAVFSATFELSCPPNSRLDHSYLARTSEFQLSADILKRNVSHSSTYRHHCPSVRLSPFYFILFFFTFYYFTFWPTASV